MKKLKLKTIATLFSIMIISLHFMSCNKSDDGIGVVDVLDAYSVPITMTLDGVTSKSEIAVYFGFGNFNYQEKAMHGYAESPNLTLGINYFSRDGSTINGARSACDKATVEVYQGTTANGVDFYSKESNPGTLKLSGKNYTLNCTVYGETNNNGVIQQLNYLLTATWTRP